MTDGRDRAAKQCVTQTRLPSTSLSHYADDGLVADNVVQTFSDSYCNIAGQQTKVANTADLIHHCVSLFPNSLMVKQTCLVQDHDIYLKKI
jgi:hypothetical protein